MVERRLSRRLLQMTKQQIYAAVTLHDLSQQYLNDKGKNSAINTYE